jgi:ATP-binding protein involved in chromosome partitioning
MHDELLRALESVIDPELGRSVIELDMVRRAELVGGTAEVTIALTVAGCPLRASFQDQVDRALLPLAGVERTALTFDVMTPEEKTALTTKLRGGVAERTPGISVDSKTRVLAVASGKGSRRFRRTWPRPSRSWAIAPASSTRTSTGTRSPTCSASTSDRSWSTR